MHPERASCSPSRKSAGRALDDTECEVDALHRRYFNPNFQAFAGCIA